MGDLDEGILEKENDGKKKKNLNKNSKESAPKNKESSGTKKAGELEAKMEKKNNGSASSKGRSKWVLIKHSLDFIHKSKETVKEKSGCTEPVTYPFLGQTYLNSIPPVIDQRLQDEVCELQGETLDLYMRGLQARMALKHYTETCM
ncbi:uncharacterized protein LOC111695528 [Eurytemora carolleeae]|uniref:uncharacterized protein LOC111695528 n=1 Tax=Eurytemora carolleeae TaxID=1294199 RepID=UPI000C76DFEB|nr:uncharacterized protein LOC111695528 [Eurytemora carolleeae]|eukprot:XP_023320664.1 uncharacterized protein LOC111695528 [Eurytemora affinis]